MNDGDRKNINDAFKELAELHYSEGVQGIAAVMVDKDGDIRMVQACIAKQSLVLLGAFTILEIEFINQLMDKRGKKPKDID